MAPFENAPPHYMRRTLRTWYSQVEPDLRDPELLWGDCWKRFNTVRIPVLPEEEYFERALEIAKSAKDRDEFEKIFEERNARDWQELLDLMYETTMHTLYHHDDFPCDDAWRKARHASQTGSLMEFVRVLKGVAFGWEADEVRESPLGNVPSGEEAHIRADYIEQGEIFPELEDLDWEEEMELRGDQSENVIYHGNFTYFPAPDSASRKASKGALCSGGEGPSTRRKPALSSTTSDPDHGELKQLRNPQRKRRRSSDDSIEIPEPNQASTPSPRSADDARVMGESHPPNNDNACAYKRQKLDDSTATSNADSTRRHDESITKKRHLCGDDDGERRHKRPKLNPSFQDFPEAESNASRISKKPLAHDENDRQGHERLNLASSSQQHADAGLGGPGIDKSKPKKRRICDDEHDNANDDAHDDGNVNDEHRHKRQRLDASSQQQAKAASSEPSISSKQNSRRSRRKRSNANRVPGNIRTRSLNRIRPSTFWELDRTGKASVRT
ncbi:hypothetical protein V8C26DRAFT_395168 [Trichoderma gracile]